MKKSELETTKSKGINKRDRKEKIPMSWNERTRTDENERTIKIKKKHIYNIKRE